MRRVGRGRTALPGYMSGEGVRKVRERVKSKASELFRAVVPWEAIRGLSANRTKS